MSKILLAAGAAALAIAAPVFADKGGQGGGQGNRGGDKGGQSMKADRGPGGGGGKAMRQADQGSQGNRGMEMRGNGDGKAARRADNGPKSHGDDHQQARGPNGDKRVQIGDNGNRIRIDSDRNDNDLRFVTRDFGRGFGGFSNNCPPGLNKKDNGCLPPGQAKKYLGARLQNGFANSLLPDQYRSWYRDDGNHFFRSGDGYIYRVNRSNNLVDGLIPLFGGDNYYARGDAWPSSYDFYNVPYQYRNYYADAGDYNYRYGDGAIYRVNSGSGVVDSIVALLAGDLGVGRQLPTGYDTYNVPFQYRDRYADSADNWYRYNDGYIYQVDPKTRLISAVIDAIV